MTEATATLGSRVRIGECGDSDTPESPAFDDPESLDDGAVSHGTDSVAVAICSDVVVVGSGSVKRGRFVWAADVRLVE